jgi:hypothetical protein
MKYVVIKGLILKFIDKKMDGSLIIGMCVLYLNGSYRCNNKNAQLM